MVEFGVGVIPWKLCFDVLHIYNGIYTSPPNLTMVASAIKHKNLKRVVTVYSEVAKYLPIADQVGKLFCWFWRYLFCLGVLLWCLWRKAQYESAGMQKYLRDLGELYKYARPILILL